MFVSGFNRFIFVNILFLAAIPGVVPGLMSRIPDTIRPPSFPEELLLVLNTAKPKSTEGVVLITSEIDFFAISIRFFETIGIMPSLSFLYHKR